MNSSFDINATDDAIYAEHELARRKANRRLTRFGKRHGGADMAWLILVYIWLLKGVGLAFLAFFPGIMPSDFTAKWDTLLTLAGILVVIDVLVVLLYFKLRYVLLMLSPFIAVAATICYFLMA